MKNVTIIFVVAVWAAAVYSYEFRLRIWPPSPHLELVRLNEAQLKSISKPVWYGLANASLGCAHTEGFATMVRVKPTTSVDQFDVAETKCESGLTFETTRCAGQAPLRSFASLITCAKLEKADCKDKPLQRAGLFSGDAYCGEAGEQDLGPPQGNDRADDPS